MDKRLFYDHKDLNIKMNVMCYFKNYNYNMTIFYHCYIIIFYF